MDCDIEFDQIISTALSLETDYPELSPPLRDQDRVFPDPCLTTEIQIPLHDSKILQQSLLELYQAFGFPHGTHTCKTAEFHDSEEQFKKLQSIRAEPHLPKGLKRLFPEEELVICKKPKVELDKTLKSPTTNNGRKRTNFTMEQTLFLINQFELNPYPDFVTRCGIAKLTSISESRIQVWFQNRRARHPHRPLRVKPLVNTSTE
ncbi:homeobox protein siamois-like [Bombina bombina]|uniref:homeobox protein siamois-like n=1 Tax=Bombina bombina TaxID=8345 RepID=UPI00235AC664|nr:homeobox protein siamois-like [Bombina bombina]XP_053575457.1 homeobox protein siamois-like [Bombina bombina]